MTTPGGGALRWPASGSGRGGLFSSCFKGLDEFGDVGSFEDFWICLDLFGRKQLTGNSGRPRSCPRRQEIAFRSGLAASENAPVGTLVTGGLVVLLFLIVG